MIKYTMGLISVGSQAGKFDSKLVVGFLVDLIEKCHTVQRDFGLCMDNIREGRQQIQQTEEVLDAMQRSFGQFNETLDVLSSQALRDRTSTGQRNAQIERLRRDIALREDKLSKLMEQTHHLRPGNEDRRLQDIRDERNRIELQLARVSRDIDQTYEDAYEVEDKLERLRELHQQKRIEARRGISVIKDKCRDMATKKRRVLTLNNADNTIDLSDLYVSPAAFRKLEVEVEDMKHRQAQADRHIQMQKDERAFLKGAAEEIIQKVYDLEMKVRKETGDHGYHSQSTEEPNWYQDLGAPTVWQGSGTLTLEQIKHLRERQNRIYGTAQVLEIQDNAASTSAYNDEMVMVDLTSFVLNNK